MKLNNLLLNTVNTSCDKVLLDAFAECIKTKKYNRLKKIQAIPVPKFILKQAWTILFEEYCRISKNLGYELFYEQMRKVYRLDAKLLSINSCVRTLTHQYDQQSIDILRSFGYNYKFNQDKPNQFIEDLNKVINKSKTVLIERDREKLRFEAQAKSTKKAESGIDHFHASLITLSKYMGYRLDPHKITISEFCAITTGYEKEIEHLINQK